MCFHSDKLPWLRDTQSLFKLHFNTACLAEKHYQFDSLVFDSAVDQIDGIYSGQEQIRRYTCILIMQKSAIYETTV
jgi:hypothetical protein